MQYFWEQHTSTVIIFYQDYQDYQDPSMKMHTDMDGHRQGKEANAYKCKYKCKMYMYDKLIKRSLTKSQKRYKYPLTFLKWWSSLVLNTFTVSAETIQSPKPVPLLTNPASILEPLLEQFKTVPLLAPSPITWKNLSGSNYQNLSKTSISWARKNLVYRVVSPRILNQRILNRAS